MSLVDDPRDPETETLLAAYRSRTAVPAEVEARVWQRLSTAPATRRARLMGPWAVGLAAAAAIAIGLTLGLSPRASRSTPGEAPDTAVMQRLPSSGGARQAVQAAPVVAPPIAETEAPASPSTSETTQPDVPDPTTGSRRREPEPPRPVPAPAGSAASLAAELELLEQARRALASDDAPAALRALERAGLRFPRGALLEEREALGVIALCEAGRRSEARAARRRFLDRFATSPLAARIERACEPAASSQPPSRNPARTD